MTSCVPSSEDKPAEDAIAKSFGTDEESEVPEVPQNCVVDRYKPADQNINRKLDILIVPDTSASIKKERKDIANGLDKFVAMLPDRVDYNVGVILGHSGNSNHAGKLYKKNHDPYVLKSSELSLAKIQEYLSLKIHKPKTDGYSDGGEMGMYSLLEALEDPANLADARSKGMFREDASLVVIFIADENDVCAEFPAGVIPVVDPQNGENRSFKKYCIDKSGNRIIKAQKVYDSLKNLQGERPLIVGGVLYDETSVIPTGNEDEIGYGYTDVLELANGINVDLGSGSYGDGLSKLGRLATSHMDPQITFPLSFLGVLPDSIKVSVDGSLVSFNREEQMVTILGERDPLSIVDVEYCEDVIAPAVTVSIADGTTFNESPVGFEFSVADATLKEVRVLLNGELIYLGAETQKVLTLNLVEGVNSLDIVAKDASLLESVVNLTINYIKDEVPVVKPTANLALSQSEIFKGESITLDASGSVAGDFPIVEYRFSGFGESISQTTNLLTRSFPNAGTFTLQVEVIDSKGNTSVSSKSLTVKDILPPSINIAVSSTEIFQGENVQFDLSSSTKGTFPITSYELVVEGNTLSQNTPVFNYTFQNIGDINVVYKVKDERGLEASDNINIRVKEIIPVNQAPVASFTMSATEITVGDTVHFDASASSDDKGIVEYAWSFGTSATKDVFTPLTSYTFMQAGTFEVTLNVFDVEDLQSAPVTQTIVVNEDTSPEANPIAYFKFERAAELNDFGEEETFILLEFFSEAGSSPIASAEYEILQTGQKFTPRDFYVGTPTEIEGLPFGIYDIKLTVTDQSGKSDSITHNVVLNGDDQDPILNFELKQAASNTAFINLLKSFDPVDFYFEFEVNWGDGHIDNLSDQFSELHTYAVAGTYDVTVTSTSPDAGTSTVLTKQITVSNESTQPLYPIANYVKWQEDFAGHVRFYQEISASPNGEIISSHWDFGDGSEGFGNEVAHFYEPGVYLVKLTVTDQMGMRDSQTQRVVITEPGPPTLVGGECWSEDLFGTCFAIALDDFEQLSTVSINWGDGSVDNFDVSDSVKWYELEEGHLYEAEGNYDVVVTANTLRGESVVFETTINTSGGGGGNQAPIADFYCYQNELVVECFNNSFDPDGFITSASLNMGDGTSYDAMSGYVVHEYQDAGEYTITLNVEDNDFLTSQSSINVNVIGGVNQVPIASLFCRSTIVNQLDCDLDGIDDDGTIVSKVLSFDDGQEVSFGAGPSTYSKTFATGGDHEVTLRVTDNEGAVGESTVIYFVKENQAPVVKFSCFSGSPNQISCNSTSTDDTGIVSTIFDMGEGTTIEGTAITHTYAEGGEKSIKLTVVDNYGLNSEQVQLVSVIIDQKPEISSFLCSSTNENITCNFTLSDDIDSSLKIRSFVDGVEYSYESLSVGSQEVVFSGSYNGDTVIRLEVEDSYLNKITYEEVISVNLIPVGEFTCGQEENTLFYCDATQVLDSDGEIVDYKWEMTGLDLIDQKQSILSMILPNFGNYVVKLTVTDNDGGVYTTSKEVTVYDRTRLPVSQFVTVRKDLNTINANANLVKEYFFEIKKLEWFIDDSLFEVDLYDIDINITGKTEVTIKLYVTDIYDRVAEFSKIVIISPNYVPAPTPEADNLTNLGIDADANGLSDRVQSYISSTGLSIEIENLLLSYGSIHEEVLRKHSNGEDPKQKFVDYQIKENCIQNVLGSQKANVITSFIKYLTYNNEYRFKAFLEIKDSITPAEYETLRSTTQVSCNE
tara:strand:- start:160838 stop:166063 length:5226 start_codon:yes stop_codon:yes gene_type:complete